MEDARQPCEEEEVRLLVYACHFARLSSKWERQFVSYNFFCVPNGENTLTAYEDWTKLFSQFLCTESMNGWNLIPDYRQQPLSNQAAYRVVVVKLFLGEK